MKSDRGVKRRYRNRQVPEVPARWMVTHRIWDEQTMFWAWIGHWNTSVVDSACQLDPASVPLG
jgi:hypothetical protein